MKLTYFQAEAQIKKGLSPIYILSGEEVLLKQDVARWIRRAAKAADYAERVSIISEQGFNWDELYTHLYGHSLLAERKLIEINATNVKLPKAATELLKEYAANPAPDILLMLDVGKADSKMTKTKWFQSLEKNGSLINIWPIDRPKLPQWLVARAKKYRLTLPLPAANALADLVEGNLLAAQQALEKLYLLQSTEAITADTISTLLTNNSQFSIFELVDAMTTKHKARTLNMLATLKTEGSDPILVLWAITRELRTMAQIQSEMQSGANLASLFTKHRIFSKRQQSVRQFLQTTSQQAIRQSLVFASHIDQALKGLSQRSPWDSLELLLLKIITTNNQAVSAHSQPRF